MNTATLPAMPLFEGKQLTTLTDEKLGLLYHADDAGTILGYSNPRDAIRRHCREAGVVKRDTRSGGQRRAVTYITEANPLRLIAGSKLPNAESFERWVFEELVPTVLKTGSYTAQGAEVSGKDASVATLAKIARDTGDYLRKTLKGILPETVAALVIDETSAITGRDYSAWKKAIPAIEATDAGILIAGDMARELGLKNAQEFNKIAEAKGLQVRRERPNGDKEWELTDDGVKWAQMAPMTTDHGKAVFQIKWKRSALELFRTIPTGARLNLFAA